MSIKITLSNEQIKQILLAIDLMENTLEDLSQDDLEKLGIEINKSVLFELATELEEKGEN